METWLYGPTALVVTKLVGLCFLFTFLREVFTWNNLKTFLNELARTDRPKSEWGSSIIINVKHYICKVKTDSQENLKTLQVKRLIFLISLWS